MSGSVSDHAMGRGSCNQLDAWASASPHASACPGGWAAHRATARSCRPPRLRISPRRSSS
eukprot:620659-Heterocapsa_arctica.AAC.1